MTKRLQLLWGTGLGTLLLLAGSSCSGGDSSTEGTPTRSGEQTASDSADAGPLPYRFTDITADSGLDAFTQVNGTPEKAFVVESFGAGVALFDPDNDGDLDAYLSNGGLLEGPGPKSSRATPFS